MNIWVAINKDNSISLHTIEPKRNVDLGIWVSTRPYINMTFLNNIKQLIEQTHLSWQSEPECLMSVVFN